MNNPLRHVGQTAHPEDKQAPASQSGDAGDDEARQRNPGDAPPAAGADAKDVSRPPTGKKEIPDLEPGEPPPESSAGS